MFFRTAALVFLMLVATPHPNAQTPNTVPVPSQFATAQTAFLGAGGAPALSGKELLVVNMMYESMYSALSASRQYQLTTKPADAELSMEISIVIATGVVNGTFNDAFLRLAVHDTRTNATLWIIDQPLKGAFREATFRKNIDDAVATIISDLKTLAASKLPEDGSKPPAPTKTRLSDEGKK